VRTPGKFGPPSTPPVTPRTAWNQKPSSSEKKEPRALQLRGKPQIATHQRSHSTGVDPAQQLKVKQAQAPLKKAKVGNAVLIDRFVRWLRGDDGGHQLDVEFIDQLGQVLKFDAIRNELIPYINQFTSEEIATALARLGQIDHRELKSEALYFMCLGALVAREDALKTLKQPVLSSGRVSASKMLQDLKAEGAQLFKAYVTALVEGDEQAAVAPMKRLAEITEQIIGMKTGKHRQKVISAVIRSWIEGLGLAERQDKEKIYQSASHFEFEEEFGEVRESLLDRLESEINKMLAQAFIEAVRDGDKAEFRQAAVKLQEHCLRRDADPTREDLRERLEGVLEDCLEQHPLSADDKKKLRANLPHRSEAVKILRDLIKGERKVPALKLPKPKLPNVALPSPRALFDSPRSPFKSPRKQGLAASTPAQSPLSLAASAPSAPRPDPKGVAAMGNFIFQLLVEDRKGIETSFYELGRVILSLEVEMNALDPLIDAALKDAPTEGLETIAAGIEKGFGVQDVVFRDVQQRLSGRVWAELIVRQLSKNPDVNEKADLTAAYKGLAVYISRDESDTTPADKVEPLFARALKDRTENEIATLSDVRLEGDDIGGGFMNALFKILNKAAKA
jgi:hypothetical protein